MIAAVYTSEGVVLTIKGTREGLSVVIPDSMTLLAIEHHVRELVEWLGDIDKEFKSE